MNAWIDRWAKEGKERELRSARECMDGYKSMANKDTDYAQAMKVLADLYALSAAIFANAEQKNKAQP